MLRSSANRFGFRCGVSWELIDTTAERLPSRVDAMNCV